jgi:xanthine/CO dehydrogenase XdhC/CoxF family maturation factor
VFTAVTIRDAFPSGDRIPTLFGRGVTATALEEDAAVVVLWPVPTLVVVGDGLIADALRDAANLLGWQPLITSAASATAGLHPGDAVVVLSHDRATESCAFTYGRARPRRPFALATC